MNTDFNIALVDDQEMTRIAIGTLLERRLNANVIKADSARQLFIKLSQGPTPDLIITDLAMPEMGGITLCKKLKLDYPALRIMVLTVYKDQGMIDKLKNIGVEEVMSKDTSIDHLIASIRRLLSPDGREIKAS